MPQITPLTKDQLFEKKIAENTGSDYNVGDISDVVPVTKDQSFLKEIALNSAGQSGDITELEEKVADNTAAIEATQDMISDAYDSTHTYNVGDYCIHEDVLYKCNTASTTGTWDSLKWDATTVTEVLINGSTVQDITSLFHVETTTLSECDIKLVGHVLFFRMVTNHVSLTNGTLFVGATVANLFPAFSKAYYSIFEYDTGKPVSGGLWIDNNDGSVRFYGDTLPITKYIAYGSVLV